MFCRFGRRDGPGERDLLSRFERRAAPVGEFDDVELFRVLKQQTEPHEFTADGAPFGTRMFAANVVGGKRLMAEFADFFRVRAAQHLDDVLEADAETAFLADAINARQKFLRGKGSIPSLPRREAVVASAAIGLGSAGLRPGQSWDRRRSAPCRSDRRSETFPRNSPAKTPAGRSRPRRNESSAPIARGRFRVPCGSGFSSMNRICLTRSPGLNSSRHSPGRPSRPARPVSW